MGSRAFGNRSQLTAADGQPAAGPLPCRYSRQDASVSAGHLAVPVPAHAGCPCVPAAQAAEELEATDAGSHHPASTAGNFTSICIMCCFIKIYLAHCKTSHGLYQGEIKNAALPHSLGVLQTLFLFSPTNLSCSLHCRFCVPETPHTNCTSNLSTQQQQISKSRAAFHWGMLCRMLGQYRCCPYTCKEVCHMRCSWRHYMPCITCARLAPLARRLQLWLALYPSLSSLPPLCHLEPLPPLKPLLRP